MKETEYLFFFFPLFSLLLTSSHHHSYNPQVLVIEHFVFSLDQVCPCSSLLSYPIIYFNRALIFKLLNTESESQVTQLRVTLSPALADAKSPQSCLTLSNPMDCSPPGSSIHAIFQARVLEWGAIAFSRPSLQAN